MKYQLHFFLLFFIALAIGCSKTETISGVTISDIYPLKPGKVFYYRLDSTVLANFNQNLVVHSYNAKDSVDNEFVDNEGRKSFIIFRYLRDTLNTKSWTYTATYVATFDANRIEYVDNNLRFVVLTNLPKENNTWKGTQYINSIFGIRPPIMNEHLHETLCVLFIEIQQPWALFCPITRTNFFNYTYTLYQLCVLLDQTQYLPYIPLMKDREKQLEQDQIWCKVCKDLDWEYYPTV